MNHRIDHRLCDLNASPVVWSEPSISIIPTKDAFPRVNLDFISCEDLNKKVLDPKLVNIENLLKSGTVIDPAGFVNAFSITDPADLESLRSRAAAQTLKYIQDNESSLIEQLKSSES